MMPIKRFLIFLSLICFLGLYAQEEQSLEQVLTFLETEYDVKFSYSATDVEAVKITLPKTVTNLKSVVEYLNNSTLLNFQFLNDRYITVSTKGKQIAVCGTLFVTKSKQPLYGASIVVNGTSVGVISGNDGYFEIDSVETNSTITISYLGFETQSFAARELWRFGGCKTITLIEQSEALNQIIIKQYLTRGIQKQSNGDIVLNVEEFGALPGLIEPDVMQSIQALPGVESVNESISNINVRGGTNDQNLILWDNIKMYHSGHFFGLISAYNPYLTEKIIVSKNGTSSEFSDGVSSTISMYTKDDIKDKFSGGFGASSLYTDAFLEIPLNNKLALHVSGRRSFTDVFGSPAYDNYFERSFQDSDIGNSSVGNTTRNSEFSFYDVSAKLLYNLDDNHKFRINALAIFNDLDFSESVTDGNQTESKRSNLVQDNVGVGGRWNAKWNNKFSTELSAYYSKYNVDAEDEDIETDQQITQTNEVLETGAKIKAKYSFDSMLNILGGYQFTEVGISNGTTVTNPDFFRRKKDVLLNHSVFSDLEYSNSKTYIRAGVRTNYFQKFDKFIIEPRLSVRHKLNNQWALNLKGEIKNQSAVQIIDFQDDFLGVENRRWILANDDNIPISESRQASLGVEYNFNNFFIDVEAFYKKVDGITASNQGFYNNFQFVNAIGNYIAKGVEFLINKKADNYSTWVSYTFSKNDYNFNSLTPSEFPNNVDIRHSASLAFNYSVLNNLEISVGGIWRSGQPFTKPIEGNETVQSGNNTFVNYDDPNSENLPDFMRLDASLNYKFNMFKNIDSMLRIGVLNILDRENVINQYYEVNPNDSNSAVEVRNTSLGFTPNMSLRFDF